MSVTPSDRDAFEQMLERFNARRPAEGWAEHGLPRLTLRDYATILQSLLWFGSYPIPCAP